MESYDGKGNTRVKWQIRNKVIPAGSRQLFLPLYLQDSSTIKLRTAGIHMSGISDVDNGFLIHRIADYHLVIFTQEGEAELTAAGRTLRMGPYSILFSPAGQEHRYHPVPGSGNWKFFWFHLLPLESWNFISDGPVAGKSASLDYLFHAMDGFISEVYPLHDMMQSDSQVPFFYADAPLLENSMSEFNMKNSVAGATGLASCYADLILGYLHREVRGLFHQAVEYGDKQRLEKLWEEIARSPSGDWSLEKIAAKLNMSVSTFLRLIRKIYDTTPSNIILHIRLRTAARLLAESDQSIYVIAEYAGYGSMSSFAAAFKNHFQCSPREYRRRSRDLEL